MGSPFLYEPDLEIERTFRLRRKRQRLEEQRRKARRASPIMTGGDGEQRRTLTDFVTSGVQDITSSIAHPSMEANNFELKLCLISMVQQSQLGGTSLEDPNLHLSVFLEVCDTLKLNGVSTSAIRLHLFPFSLRDKARAWFHSLPPGCITTWDELTRAFLAKFIPSSKVAILRNQINNFTQKDDEKLYEAWEQFKDLLRLYPHYGLQQWMIVQAFYNKLTQSRRSTIDVAAGGTLINR